jgi:hypothetical protein
MPLKSDADPTRSGSESGTRIHNTGKVMVREEGPKIETLLPLQMPTSTDMASDLKTSPKFSTGTQPRANPFQPASIRSN